METTAYLQKILDAINRIKEKEGEKFYAQLKNALRVYYLGIDSIFIVNRILKNSDFSSLNLSEDEKPHVENAGWLLDKNYINDVYLGVLKANLILDVWLVLNSNKKTAFPENRDFLEWYAALVNSLNNDSSGTDDKETKIVTGEILKIEKDKKIDFITPEIVLNLVDEVVRVYKSSF
jgi:hypothetical protein